MFRFGFMDNAQDAAIAVQNREQSVAGCADEYAAEVQEIAPPEVRTDAVNATFVPLSVRTLQLQRVAGEGNLSSDPETDLIPGVYEGGLQIWECSIDLAEYLVDQSVQLADAAVIELGCGHGIPGITALALGARVTFSDFNAEVLERVTWKNICANAGAHVEDVRQIARCISGDWTALSRHLVDEHFDVILSAETTYTEASCGKVIRFIAQHLTVSGIALIATKRYYFGVGGGSGTLLEQVSRYPAFQIERVKVIEDGRSNTREIFLIKRRGS